MMGQSRLADNIKQECVANRPDGYAAIQRGLDRLEKWADRNMKFNKGKLRKNNPMQSRRVLTD